MKSTVMAVSWPEAQLTLFLHMRLWFARDIWRYRNVFWLIDWLIERNCQNIAKMYSDTQAIPLLQEIGITNANDKVRFWPAAQFTKNRKFLLSVS